MPRPPPPDVAPPLDAWNRTTPPPRSLDPRRPELDAPPPSRDCLLFVTVAPDVAASPRHIIAGLLLVSAARPHPPPQQASPPQIPCNGGEQRPLFFPLSSGRRPRQSHSAHARAPPSYTSPLPLPSEAAVASGPCSPCPTSLLGVHSAAPASSSRSLRPPSPRAGDAPRPWPPLALRRPRPAPPLLPCCGLTAATPANPPPLPWPQLAASIFLIFWAWAPFVSGTGALKGWGKLTGRRGRWRPHPRPPEARPEGATGVVEPGADVAGHRRAAAAASGVVASRREQRQEATAVGGARTAAAGAAKQQRRRQGGAVLGGGRCKGWPERQSSGGHTVTGQSGARPADAAEQQRAGAG
nr:vegetative cell wall protein gp1-like [Aegilops tauschii subsp. strangulata]